MGAPGMKRARFFVFPVGGMAMAMCFAACFYVENRI
jgi:hypothetical protein